MDCLTFLNRDLKGKCPSILVVHGDESFLKQMAIARIKEWALGKEADDLSLSLFTGDSTDWSAVIGDLGTPSFFGGNRLVLVEAADPFVSKYRAKLEKYVGEPLTSGSLVLEVKTWTSTTKLAKLIPGTSTITCKAPSSTKLVEWTQQWAVGEHKKAIAPRAARLLVDLVGSDMGLLHQELAKLTVYVGDQERIEMEDVDCLVGNNRTEKTFKIFERIGRGQVAEALTFLDSLITQGEEPLRLLGAFGWHLRRLAQAARASTEGVPLTQAIKEAGLFDIQAATQQLRHLGMRRIQKIYPWLLEVDLGMKGDSDLAPRAQLERLIIRLARQNPTTPTGRESR